jgi:phosphate transport system substrate-binding protein
MKKLLALTLGVGMLLAPSLLIAEEMVYLTGAGASFPYPLYAKWISVYQQQNPGVMINYQSIGSGGGIKQITAKTVDFGATDAPMSAKELAEANNAKIFHIPTTIGAVAIGYNVPGVANLKLTRKALAGIYLGKIKRWNDSTIAAANSGINLPDAEITVVRRSDGSGTTDIFTDYLSKISLGWKAVAGHGKSVSWPTGIGAKGNEGVSGMVLQMPYSIGYMNLAYAVQNNIAIAELENKSGNFVGPTSASASKAVEGIKIPDTLQLSLVNSSNADAYPIVGFTWLLVYKKQTSAMKGKALIDFIRWSVTEGQQYCEGLNYAPLSSEVVEMVKAKLSQVEL